jgi:hypothetical protein
MELISQLLYLPVMKATKARLLKAIATEYGCFNLPYVQAFLYGNIGDDKVYIQLQDWWH